MNETSKENNSNCAGAGGTVSQKGNNLERIQKLQKMLSVEIKAEGKLDFMKVADDYEMVQIPITCGYATGKVYVYAHKEDQFHDKIINILTDDLTQQLDKKKHNESVLAKEDIGPPKTVAKFIEHGDYDRFLDLFNEKVKGLIHQILEEDEDYKAQCKALDRKLEGIYKAIDESLRNSITPEIHHKLLADLQSVYAEREHLFESEFNKKKLKSAEHIFIVQDDRTGNYYTMMPIDEEEQGPVDSSQPAKVPEKGKYRVVRQTYDALEQKGLILVSVCKSLQDELHKFSKDDAEKKCVEAISDWIEKDGKKNPILARRILEKEYSQGGSRIYTLTGEDYVYKRCLILKNPVDQLMALVPKQ